MSPKVTKRPPGPKDHAASTRTDARSASPKKQKEMAPSVATAFETIGKSVTAFAKDVGDTTQRLAKSARVFAHTIRTETQRPDKNIVQVIEDGFADAAQAFAPKPDFAILADEAEAYLDTIRHLAKSDPKLKPAALEMAAQYQGILGAGIASAVWDYQHDPESRSVAQRQAMDLADAFYREVPTEESLDGVFATYTAVDRDVAKLRRAVVRNAETIRTHVSKEARGAAASLLDAADRSLPMGDIQFQKTLPAGPEAIFLQAADQSHLFARAENAILEPLLTATESRITTLVQSAHAESKFYRAAHLGMAQVHMGSVAAGVRHLESARQIFRDEGDAKPAAKELSTQIEVLHRIATNSPDDAQLAKDRLSEADSMIDLLGHDKGSRDKATLFRIDNLLHTLPHRIQEHDENLKHNPDNVEAYHRAVAREHQKIIDYCSRVKSKDPAIVALAHGNGMIQASVQFEKRLDAAMSLRLVGETDDARKVHLDAQSKFTQTLWNLDHTASPTFMHEAMGRMHWANATYTFKTGEVEESLRDLRTLSTTYGASGAAQILKDGSGDVWVHHYGIVDDHGNFSPDIGKPSEVAKWKKIADAALDDKASAMKAMMAGAGVAIVGAASADALFGTHVIGAEVLGGLTLGKIAMVGAGAGLITERGYQVLSAQREISSAYTTGIANVTTEELADRGKALAGEVAVCFLAGGAARYVRMGVTTLGTGLRAPLLRGLISESGIVAEGIAFHEFAGAIHGETDRSALGYFRSILTLRMLAAGNELNLGSLLFPGEAWADAVMRHGFNTAVANIPLQAFESAIARNLSGFGQGYFDGLFGLYAITLGGKIPETVMRAPQILAQAKAMHQERSARKLITRAETLANTISTLQSNRDYARTPTEKTDLTKKLVNAMRAHAAAYQKLASMGLYPADAAADYAEGVGAFTQFAEMAIQHQKSATPSKAKVTAQQIATRTRKLTKSTVRYGKLAVVAPALLMTGAIGGMGGGGQRRVAHSIPEHFLQIIGVGTGWSREGLNIAEQTRKNPQRAAGAILNHLINLISLAHYVDTPEPETQAMARAAMTEMYTLLETLLLLPPEVRPSGRSDGASHDVAFIRALNSRRGSQPFTKDALKYIDRQFETHYSEMLDEGGPRAAAHLSDLDAMWGEPVDLSDVNKFWPLLGTKPEEMPKATRMVRTIVESRAQELGVAEKDVCVTIAGAGRNASEVLIWLRAGAKVHVVEPEEGAIASLERSLTRMGMSEEEGGRLTSSNEKMGKNTLETSDIVVWNFPRNAFGLAAKDLSRSLKPGGLLIVQTDFPELYVNPFTTRDASKEFEPIFSRPLSRQNFLIPSGHLSLVSMADLAIFRRAMPESGTLSKSDAREPSRKWVEEAAPRPTLEAKAVVDRGVSRYEKEIGREYNVISNNIDFEGQDPQSLIDRASRKLADGSFTPDAYAHAARAYRGQLQHVIGKVRRAIYHTRSTTSVAKIFASATSGITLSPADAHSVLNTIVAAMRTRARAAAYVQLTQAKLDTQLMDAAENNKVMSGHEIDAARNRIITALLSEGSGKTISANAGRMALSEMDGILVIRPDNELVYQSIHSAYRDNRGVTEDSPEGFSTVTSNLGVAVVVVRPEHPGGRALLQREHQRQWSAQSPLADQEILAHLKSGTPLSQVLATPVAKRAGAAERVHLLYEAQDQLIARGYSPEAARHSLLDALTVVSFNDWLTEIPVIRDVLMREKEDGVVPMMAHARDHRPHLRQWVETSVLAMVNGHKNLDAFLETQDRQFAEARQRLHGRLDPDHLMDMRRKWCVGETQVEQMVDVLILLANEAHTHLDVLIHRAKTNPSLSLNAQIQKAEEACVVRDELLARVQAHVTPTQFHELQTDIEGRLRFKHAYFQNKVAEQPVQQQGAPDLVSKGVQESLPFDRDPVAPERKGMTMLAGAALMADVSSGVHQVLANVADTVFAHPYATTAAIVAGIAGVRLYTDHLTQMGRVRGAIKSMGIQKLIEDRSPDPKDPIISLNAFLRGELGREPTLAEVRQFEASTLEFKERREVYYLHQTAGGSPIYQIYTKEFLDALATRITTAAQAFRAKHGRDPVIMEVAAGDGRLSRSLRARGVAITATDVFDRGWGIKHADDVISEEWTSATERADIILGSWLPHDDIQKRQVLDVPIVQHVRTHPDKTYIQIESFVTNTGHFKQFVSGAEKLKTLAVDEPREFFELMTSRLGEETTHLRIYRGIPKEGARGISETYEEAVLLFSAHLMTEAREMTRTLLDTGKAMIDRGETVRLPHTKMEFDDYGKFAHRVQQMLALDNAEWRKIVTPKRVDIAPKLPDLPPPLAPADPVVHHMAIFPDVRGLYHAALKAYQRATQPTEKFVIGISGVGRPITIKLPVAKSLDAADQMAARDAQRPILKKWVRDTIFTKELESQPIIEGTTISPDQDKVYQETRKILGQLENAMNAVAHKYFDALRQPKSAEITEGQYPPPVNVAERAALYQKWCNDTNAFLEIAALTEEMATEAEHRVEDDGDKATPLTKSIASVRRYIADRIADTITSPPWSEVDARLVADRNSYITLAQAAIDVTDPGYIVPPDPSNLQRMTPQAAEAYAVELRAHFASPTTTEAMSSLIAFDKLVRSQKLSRRAIEAAAHDVADQLVNGTAPYGSKDHPLYFADRLLGLSVPTISMSPDELMAHWTREATEAFTRHLMDAIPMHTTPPADGEYGFDDARSHESKTKVTRVPKKILESGGAGGGVFMIAAMLPAWMEGGRELYKRAVQGFFDGGQKALSKKPESTLQTPATVARNGSEHYVVIPASTRDSPPAKMPGSDGVEYRWKRGALEIRDSRESVVGTTRITIDDGESSHVLPKGKWHVLRYGNKLTIGVKTFTVSQNFSVHVPAETALAADVRKNAPQLERLINSGVSPYDCLVLLSKFAKQSVQVGPDGHVYDNLEEHIPDNAVYRVNRSTSKFRKDVEALVGIIRRQFDRGETVTGARSHTKFPSRVEVEAFFAENRLSPESHAAAKRSYPFSDRVRDMVAQSPNQTPSNLLLGLIFENETTPDAMKADTLRTMAELRDYVVSEELTWGDALYNPETGTIMFKDDLDRFIDQKVGTPGYSQALVRVHDVQSRYTPEVAGDLWGSLESLIGDAPKRTPVDAFGFYLKDSATSKAFYKTTSYEVRLGIIRDAVMKRIRSGEIVRDMSGNQLKSAADFDRLVEQKLEQSLSIRKTQKIDVPVKPTPRPMPAVSEFLPKPLAQVSHDMRVHLRPFVDAFFNRQGASLKEATQELQMLEEGDSPTVSGPRKDRKFRTTGYTRYRNADTGATRVMDPAGADEQWRDNFIAGVQQLMPDGVSPEFPAPRDGNYFIPGMQGWYWGGAMMSEGDTPGKSPWDGRIFFAVDKGNDAASDIPKASILYAELSKMATAFKSRGTKVMFKIISGRSDRSDAAILYFKAGDEAAVYERMCQLSKLGVMRDRLPLFVAPLTDTNGTMLHGIGFAQHPSGQSFGARRARILNPIMDELDREAATGVRRGRVEVEGILAAALAAGGVDPEIPAFDAGGREKFPHIFHHMRFSREGEAPTIQGVDPDLRDLLDLLDSSTRNLPRKP